MGYGVKLEVWGEFAAFNRPEMKVERVSYDVMTPSAARGILEAIYWKPEMRWVIGEIHVLNPIAFTHVRRNEVRSKIAVRGKAGVQKAMKRGRGTLGTFIEEERQQRAAMILRDVRYGICAHIEVLNPVESDGSRSSRPEAKHLDMFRRRARRGQYFHHPYLGSREFPAYFKLVDGFPPCPEGLSGERDLGYMLHDIEFAPSPNGEIVESNRGTRRTARPRFFRALMRDGIIEVPPLGVARA